MWHKEWIVVSSALIAILMAISETSLMHGRKRAEPRTESWGTPGLTEYSCKDFPSVTIWSFLVPRN